MIFHPPPSYGGGFLPMRAYKIILSLCILLVACTTAYVSFMYVYTDHMFAPVSLLVKPNGTARAQHEWAAPLVPFIHKVNTPQRAHQKDKKFGGFELDVLSQNGQLLVAHDPTKTARQVTLDDIFKTVKNPQEKVWWLDVKGELTDEEINTILRLAQAYHIPENHIFFEASVGPTAKRLTQKKVGLLLALPDGFDRDGNDPATRTKLNENLLNLWKEYQPMAVSASFGKYAYLQAYFPNLPKAIYYSATQRPSVKKFFMRRHMAQDPSVKIFMTDEYDWINL